MLLSSLLSILRPSYSFFADRLLLSVVAIHGLGGDRKGTWTSSSKQKLWLKDFLPLNLPNARIMTYGYNSSIAFGPNMSDIDDHATDLLASLLDARDKPVNFTWLA